MPPLGSDMPPSRRGWPISDPEGGSDMPPLGSDMPPLRSSRWKPELFPIGPEVS
jgi:hypothetical protein